MTSSFFFKSIEIENFRAFDSLRIDRFKRINIISGLNGVGKSALLETMFLAMDLNNPMCVIKALQWRGAANSASDLERLLPDNNKPSRIEVGCRTGKISISVRYGRPDKDFLLNAEKETSPQAVGVLNQLTAPNILGISLKALFSGEAVGARELFVFSSGNTFSSTFRTEGQELGVSATMLGHSVQSLPVDIAERVSAIIKNKRKPDLIEYLRMIDGSIENVELLQEGSITQVYLTNDRGVLPLPILGGGMRAFFEIISVSMTNRGGAIFIDELESALHYSIVPEVWSIIAAMANQENIQVFAVTHSKETILFATTGLRAKKREKDFQFIRIETDGPVSRATSYDFEEVMSASEFGLEIR